MFKSIAQDVKQQFALGNRITRLIIFNAAVFVVVNLIQLVYAISSGGNASEGFNQFLKYLSLSSDLAFDFTHPWVFLTHMFLHIGFFHFLFNMLYLFWFGRILGDFLGDHRIYPIYFLAGLTGAIAFLIAAPFSGAAMAYGASAAVMGIVAATGTIAPDYNLRLMFIGNVKLKYLVLILIALDVFALGSMANFGGHIAHLGGALFGFVFVAMLQRGSDISEPVNKLFGWFKSLVSDNGSRKKKKKSPMFTRHVRQGKGQSRSDRAQRPGDHQERLDVILEKIKVAGYDSLTAEEKEFLFQASKK
jgi:membrane associated rhomboid family serine protease